MGREKKKRTEPQSEPDEPVEAPPPVRRPEDATPEKPVMFRYVLDFKPRKSRKKASTGKRRNILKPVHVVAAKQRKRGRQ